MGKRIKKARGLSVAEWAAGCGLEGHGLAATNVNKNLALEVEKAKWRARS